MTPPWGGSLAFDEELLSLGVPQQDLLLTPLIPLYIAQSGNKKSDINTESINHN